jgi:hypothetical protein
MTAKPTVRTVSVAGAVSHDLLEWHAIDWRRVQQNVRRLQARIVKAVLHHALDSTGMPPPVTRGFGKA